MKDRLYTYTFTNPTTDEVRIFRPVSGAVICEDRLYFTKEEVLAAYGLAVSQGFDHLAVTEA